MKLKLITAFILVMNGAMAQSIKDSLPEHRNIIRFNPTPLVIFGPHYYIFGYERVLNTKQSISFNTGFIQMPSIEPLDFDSVEVLDRGKKKYGAALAFDYRFYLTKRNKFWIPDGLYIGPYSGYYYFHNEIELTKVDSAGVSLSSSRGASLHVVMIGFELGYQFIVWKNRLSIDLLLLGPSVGAYTFIIEQDKDFGLEGERLEEIKDAIIDNFPKVADVISDGSFSKSGVSFNIGPSFRYAVQIGFVF